jgi:hypothetical protein
MVFLEEVPKKEGVCGIGRVRHWTIAAPQGIAHCLVLELVFR